MAIKEHLITDYIACTVMVRCKKLTNYLRNISKFSTSVNKIVSSCDLCQRCKVNDRRRHGETKNESMDELISADCYRPLVTSTYRLK